MLPRQKIVICDNVADGFCVYNTSVYRKNVVDKVADIVTKRNFSRADMYVQFCRRQNPNVNSLRRFSVAGPRIWNGLPHEL